MGSALVHYYQYQIFLKCIKGAKEMIKAHLFDGYMTSLDCKVNKHINDNLKTMIEVFRDYIHMNDGWEVKDKLMDAFPRHYVVNSSKDVEEIIEELYEIICGSSLREYIKPVYEFALYSIIQWWIDITDEEDLIPVELKDTLLGEIEKYEEYINEDGVNEILTLITDINNYLTFCFSDWDFLPESLDNYVQLYLKHPMLAEDTLHINLDEYIELMHIDIRDLYLDARKEFIEKTNNKIQDVPNEINLEEGIIKDLYRVCCEINKHAVENKNKSEVELSNEIYRMIKLFFKNKYDVEVERESEIGCSNIKLGENDFYIYRHNNELISIAIGENKALEKFQDAYGQLLGYLSYNFQFGFTISINKEKTISEACNYIIKQLSNCRYEKHEISKVEKEPFGEAYRYIVRSTHKLPEDSLREMNIYHLILDINNEWRQDIARQSRHIK